MIRFLKPTDLETLAVSRDVRLTIEHFQKCLEKREYLPMVNPDTGEVEIAEISSPTTQNIEAIADELRAIILHQTVTASNPCQCAAMYQAYDRLKQSIIADIKNEQVRAKKLAQIDEEIQARWGDAIPSAFAGTVDDPPCPHCHRPKAVPDLLAFSSPALRKKIMALTIGGHFPVEYLALYLSVIDGWLFNEDVIPEAKKKTVQAFLDKTGLQHRIQVVYDWLRGDSAPKPSSAMTPNQSPSSIGTTDTIGDSVRPTWTPDSPPTSDDSISSNGNDSAN